ncbi:MAG: HD family phosphohydrolase [Fusobacteriota bacterium]
MKKINFLGKEFTFKVENIESDEPKSKRSSLEIRLLIIISLFIGTAIFFRGSLLNNPYSVGNKAKKVISSPVDVSMKNLTIKKGDILLYPDETIQEDDIVKLKATGIYNYPRNVAKFIGYMLFMVTLSFIFYYSSKKILKKEFEDKKQFYAILTVLTLTLLMLIILPIEYILLFPLTFSTLILTLLINEKLSLVINSILILSLVVYFNINYILLTLFLVELAAVFYLIKKIKSRTDIINIGIFIGLIKVIFILAIDLIIGEVVFDISIDIIEVFFSGIIASMLTIAILPYLENTYNILTEVKLLELADFSNPLLKKLLINAPGTFHHSILVATLAERAAEAIGADATFARVASYYHDVGKMKRPNFFVENQRNGKNPHNKLSPNLSSLVITSHTKDGQKLGKKYKIPKEIRDVMSEHQGTTLLAYFYNEAKKENPDVNEEDFKYEGPKPATKESAIIMLADSIEAAVRSLDDKNSVAVENLIRKIINGKIDSGQLSRAQLTFKDIEVVIQAFISVIQGIYHSRIKYPDIKKKKK